MINTTHLLKVAAAWTSIVYTVCFLGVAAYPPIRTMTMRYAMHMDWQVPAGYFGIGDFFSGLIIWNIAALLGVWLFAVLFNAVKE